MISLLEIAKGVKERASTDTYNTKSIGREDGETWDHAKGFAAKHKGEIRYFDINDYPEDMSNDEVNAAAEKDAKAYAKTGKVANPKDAKKGETPEEPQGDKLSGSDFDRDGGDDREEDPNYLFKQDDDDDEDESNVADANDDVIRSLEDMDLNGLDVNSVSSEIDDGMYAELMGKDVDEPDNAMTVTAFEDGGKIEYGINVGIGHEVIYFDSKEEALEATQKLAKDDKIRKAMDGEGDETLADLGDHANSIVKGKDETITINGKTYKPIKEEKKKSNPRVLKEIYDRTFRSLK